MKLNALQQRDLPNGVINFSITKTNLTKSYCIPEQRILNYITVGVEWEFEATVTYDLWLKLKPYTETRTVTLKSLDIKTVDGFTTATFILIGFGKEAPCPLQLNQGFIPIANNTKLLT